jgi:flagella basal body P-ring formation protein FlgA
MATVDGAALPAGINQPSAAVGRVLTEAIKPDNPIKPNHPAGKQ